MKLTCLRTPLLTPLKSGVDWAWIWTRTGECVWYAHINLHSSPSVSEAIYCITKYFAFSSSPLKMGIGAKQVFKLQTNNDIIKLQIQNLTTTSQSLGQILHCSIFYIFLAPWKQVWGTRCGIQSDILSALVGCHSSALGEIPGNVLIYIFPAPIERDFLNLIPFISHLSSKKLRTAYTWFAPSLILSSQQPWKVA